MLKKILLLSVAFAPVLGFAAPDCALCKKLWAEKEDSVKEEQGVLRLLADNKAVLVALRPSDLSKKVKLNSNILILTAKAEKAANQRANLERQVADMGCYPCLK